MVASTPSDKYDVESDSQCHLSPGISISSDVTQIIPNPMERCRINHERVRGLRSLGIGSLLDDPLAQPRNSRCLPLVLYICTSLCILAQPPSLSLLCLSSFHNVNHSLGWLSEMIYWPVDVFPKCTPFLSPRHSSLAPGTWKYIQHSQYLKPRKADRPPDWWILDKHVSHICDKPVCPPIQFCINFYYLILKLGIPPTSLLLFAHPLQPRVGYAAIKDPQGLVIGASARHWVSSHHHTNTSTLHLSLLIIADTHLTPIYKNSLGSGYYFHRKPGSIYTPSL